MFWRLDSSKTVRKNKRWKCVMVLIQAMNTYPTYPSWVFIDISYCWITTKIVIIVKVDPTSSDHSSRLLPSRLTCLLRKQWYKKPPLTSDTSSCLLSISSTSLPSGSGAWRVPEPPANNIPEIHSVADPWTSTAAGDARRCKEGVLGLSSSRVLGSLWTGTKTRRFPPTKAPKPLSVLRRWHDNALASQLMTYSLTSNVWMTGRMW